MQNKTDDGKTDVLPLVQDCGNSSALAMELPQPFTMPSKSINLHYNLQILGMIEKEKLKSVSIYHECTICIQINEMIDRLIR